MSEILADVRPDDSKVRKVPEGDFNCLPVALRGHRASNAPQKSNDGR
jgi:hypothetical protein